MEGWKRRRAAARPGTRPGGGWEELISWDRPLSLFFPSWRSAHRRSLWALQSLDSVERCTEGGRVTKQRADHMQKTGCRVHGCSQRGVATLWSRASSRDSFFICSFLRLAVSAVLSELALERTWAISSLALRHTSKRGAWTVSGLKVRCGLNAYVLGQLFLCVHF